MAVGQSLCCGLYSDTVSRPLIPADPLADPSAIAISAGFCASGGRAHMAVAG